MTQRAAVLGAPISHSLSPLIHNFVYQELSMNYKYSAVELTAKEFPQWFNRELAVQNTWFGFSLTMPLKEIIFSPEIKIRIDFDALSARIKSANTLFKVENQWCATSTDAKAIEYLLSPYKFDHVVIIGSGGTARAALGALEALLDSFDFSITVVRRNPKMDDLLRSCIPETELHIEDWSNLRAANDCDLLINTVPADASESIVSNLAANSILLDALYSPWPPALTRKFKENNAPVISGLDLLCWQALYQIELMLNRTIDKQELAQRIMPQLERAVFAN